MDIMDLSVKTVIVNSGTNMTTSYELSLKLKELGVEQNGEYYWVKREGVKWSLVLNKLEDYFEFVVKHKSQLVDWVRKYQPLCRAFTLGEIVMELGDSQIPITRLLNLNSVTITSLHEPLTGISEISTEEAAGELLAEIKEQEKQKA